MYITHVKIALEHLLTRYRTPLQLLAISGYQFIELNRRSSYHHVSNRPIWDDFQDTLEALYTIGNSDPFDTDACGSTAFHDFFGFDASYRWLRQKKKRNLQICPKT